MSVHDDRTFIRHFSWVVAGLAGITIFFIFLAFLLVGITHDEGHSGYTYVQYLKSHPSASHAIKGSKKPSEAAAQSTQAPASDVASNNKVNGKAIWQAHCSVCHATGVAGAPKIGDKKEWGPILKSTTLAVLHKHAIHGFKGQRGYMPPKGGDASLTDSEVEAAVDYMVSKSK